MIGYLKSVDSTKTMSFKVSYEKSIIKYEKRKKYNKIWETIRSSINIEFDSEPVYGENDKDIKTKI